MHLANQHWIKPVFGSLDVTPCTHGSISKGVLFSAKIPTRRRKANQPKILTGLASWVKIKVDLVDSWGISKRPGYVVSQIFKLDWFDHVLEYVEALFRERLGDASIQSAINTKPERPTVVELERVALGIFHVFVQDMLLHQVK